MVEFVLIVLGILILVKLYKKDRISVVSTQVQKYRSRTSKAMLQERINTLEAECIDNKKLMTLLHDFTYLMQEPDAGITINTERAIVHSGGKAYVVTTEGIKETSEWVMFGKVHQQQ